MKNLNQKELRDTLKLDIENAEKFFDRTGNSVKNAYKELDEDIDKTDDSGIQKIFLYIPGTNKDMYNVFLN